MSEIIESMMLAAAEVERLRKENANLKELLRTQEIKWTTEPPKENGIYWAKENGGDVVCLSVEINKDFWIEHKAMIWEFGNDDYTEVKFYSHWLGPLPVPEPPKE